MNTMRIADRLHEMLEDYERVVNATNAILSFRKEELKEMIL